MSNEEFNRRMEFLLNQQARFDAGMHDLRQELRESQRSTNQSFAQANQSLAQANQSLAQTNQSLAQTADTIERFSRVMFESFKATDEKLKALADSQTITEEKLQHLIATVDRHISDGHGGA